MSKFEVPVGGRQLGNALRRDGGPPAHTDGLPADQNPDPTAGGHEEERKRERYLSPEQTQRLD